MIAFPGNPGKLEKMLLQVALSAKMGLLIKGVMEPMAVLAGFCAISMYFSTLSCNTSKASEQVC